MNKFSHPLVGDYKYGDRFHNRMYEQEFGADNLFLHAHSIQFRHPHSLKEIRIVADFPENWKRIAKRFEWKLPELG